MFWIFFVKLIIGYLITSAESILVEILACCAIGYINKSKVVTRDSYFTQIIFYKNFSVFVDASDACNRMDFQFGNNGYGTTIPTRSWSIKVLKYIGTK